MRIYKIDDNQVLVGYDDKPEDYQITDEKHEILTDLPNGLYEPISYNFDSKRWSGVTREEWLDNQPTSNPVVPSTTMLAINALGLQVAKLMAEKGGN
ncbi:hypothetical protein ACYUMT_03820 [Latilactobacillus sakei]